MVVQLVGEKVRRDRGINQDVDHRYTKKSTSTGRIDLNDLLERVHAEEKKDSKTNFLILSGAVGVSLVVVLILSF